MRNALALFIFMMASTGLADFALPLKTPRPRDPASVPAPTRLLNQLQKTAPAKATIVPFLVGANMPNANSPSSTNDAAPPTATEAPTPAAKTSLAALATKGVNPGARKSDGFSGGGSGNTSSGASDQSFSYNGGGGKSGGGGGTAPQENGGGSNKKKETKTFPSWYPMCVFMDGAVRNGNEVVKGLVDMAAKCEVNLVVFPFYSKNIPGDAAGLKEAARNKCNAQDGFRKNGVNRASAIVLTGNRNLPSSLCSAPAGPDNNVCGEMGWDPGEGIKERMGATGRWVGFAPPGKPAVGVVAPGPSGYFNIADVAAVTGQTFLNRPPGYAGGNGTGDVNEGQAAGGVGDKQGWSDSGCQAMRDASFQNDGRWKYSPDQKDYVVKGDDEKRFLDFKSDKTIFSKPSPPKNGEKGGGDDRGGGGGGAIAGNASGGAQGSGNGARGGGSGAGSAPFAYQKNSASGRGNARAGGRNTSPSDPLYSSSVGGAESAPTGGLPEVAPLQPDEPAGSAGVPGVIALNGAKGAGIGGQNTGYDESARRGGGAAGGSALSNAAEFFGGGAVAGAAEKKASPLDADFFKKLFQPADGQTSWRRKPGASLRKDPVVGDAPVADRSLKKSEPPSNNTAISESGERVVNRGDKTDSRKASRAPASDSVTPPSED